MELLRFCFAIFFISFVNGQIPLEPFYSFDDPTPLHGPMFTDRSSLTYAAVRDISIRPFRKRPPALQYQVELEDETFNVTLLQNEGLTSPGCLVHHYELSGRKKLYPCNRRKHNCFYTGKSDSHNDSWVAADVCHGLRGVLSIGNLSYFFDPMTSNSSRINGGHVHTVYRYQGDKHICAVNDRAELHVAHGNRRKRDIIDQSETKYVETRVVIDPHMVLYHGSSDITEHYAYMAFNIANKVYKHKSLGQTVQLVISEFHIIEGFNDFASKLKPDADETLKVFCNWQQKLASTVDANVLFTRINIRDKARSEAVNGYSYTKGMCKNHWNCALVEDQGPIIGITVAHEIGHLLGMSHNPIGTTGIMNAAGWSGQEAFEWSTVSASAFLAHATQHNDPLKCLRNRPRVTASKGDTTPPGILYSADKQCQLTYNKTAYFVQNIKQDVCQNMICGFTDSELKYISSAPLVDGTDCYNNRSWCMSGKCVPIGTNYNYSVPPIDGAWSAWLPYTQCSRTCDGGVKIARRVCNNPMPQFGGKNCVGSMRRAKLCNMRACDPQRTFNDDRDKQCQSRRQADVDVHCNGRRGCSSCQGTICPHGQNQGCKCFAFDDGTECRSNDGPYNRCVDRQCMSFGCDGKSNSKMVYDKCGVCNGTGTSCIQHTDVYDKNGLYQRYADVVTIPKSSSYITVNQWNRYCFLSVAVNGTRILNDNKHQQRSMLVTVLGIQLRYEHPPERIQIIPKIPTDIVIQVFRMYGPPFKGVYPNVTYSFYTDNNPMMYAWAIVPNSTCSKECGTGQRTDDILCMHRNGAYVDELHCKLESKPHEVVAKPCNTHSCPPTWVGTPWSTCSVPCGTGIKTRNVTCIVETSGTAVVLSPSRCQHLKHPVVESMCYLNNCTGTWVKGNWSECSTTCGEGKQTRTVKCKARYGQNWYPLKYTECDSHRPDEEVKCYHGPCYVSSKAGDNCKDVSKSCEYYAIGAPVCDCINSSTNCPRTCGVCTNSNCYDQPLCGLFQASDCGRYISVGDFLSQNCSHKCGLCQANKSCEDKPVCESFKQNECIQKTVTMTNFLFQNCPQKCGVCNKTSRCFDDVDCVKYDSIYCGDPQYARWMYRNCPQTCGVCRDCMDCSDVTLAECTRPDKVLEMRKYCSKTCKFCHGNVLQG